MIPNWENTFNSELRNDWHHLGYALTHARQGGYYYILWKGKVYLANIQGTPTKYTKRDLYLNQG